MRKKDDKEDLVKKIVHLNDDFKELTPENLKTVPVNEPEPQTKLTAKEMADSLGVRYIEPKRKMKAFGVLPEQQKKEHERDWEYVKGIYENIEAIGESIEFWHCIYPGDPDCLWEIPANVPVYVPRMIAKHLEDVQQYHKFDYVDRPKHQLKSDEFMEKFTAVQTNFRGKFRAIEAFK